MFTISYNKKPENTYTIQDNKLESELKKLFPNENKHFYNWLKSRIMSRLYYRNDTYTIQHNKYNIDKMVKFVNNQKTISFNNLPTNKDILKKEQYYNQWMVLNTSNGAYASFPNLAALCRTLNIEYNYLHNGIVNNGFFTIGKYRFSRNTIPEKDHNYSLLNEVL